LLPVALPVDIQVEVVAVAGPLYCNHNRASVGLPERGWKVDVEVEVIADEVQSVNGPRALGGVRGECERIELTLP